MKPNVLPGHSLRQEGAPFTKEGVRVRGFVEGEGVLGARVIREGRALCTCGEVSEALQSNAARKRWHRGHKDRMRGLA